MGMGCSMYDTIAAPATGMTGSGIGIVRVSGAEALMVAARIFPKVKEMASHTIRYGFIYEDGHAVDEVMVSVMKQPHSYTKEDVVEINCHGGPLMMNKILQLLLKNGARLAEPGEFTKRAYLNGRIDLAEAEAVMDIIQAKNDFALKSSVRQLVGAVSDYIRLLREEIIYQIAFIEAALDDPEHISLDGYGEILTEKVDDILSGMQRLLQSAQNGRILREGINTVIVGKPNVGKSSLLNLLLGEERAIVTDIAGTTRDTLEETVIIEGIILNVVDTAGIRQTDNKIEKIGVERTKKYARNADLIIYMIDSSLELEEEDRAIIRLIRNKKVIVLLNKVDLPVRVTENDFIDFYLKSIEDIGDNTYPQVDKYEDKPIVIRTSMKEKNETVFGQVIKEMFLTGDLNMDEEIYITNVRHQAALTQAYESILLVKDSLQNKMPEDFYTIDMMNAYEKLGLIIGERVEDDLVKEIFAKFCTGK